MRAYDIEMLTRPVNRADPQDRGWVFGLPPGIAPEQWPLDPNNGYPLMHGFTIELPEDYRCHGPDIVALSFFATAPDHNEGWAFVFHDIAATFAPGAPKPSDPVLRLFWAGAQPEAAHARLHRFADLLGCAYAAILLTQEEYAGALCPPPDLIDPARERRPGWLRHGAAADYHAGNMTLRGQVPDAENLTFQQFGAYPDGTLAFHRAIRWAPRANDPNAGLSPQERWVEVKSGYVPEWIEVDGEPATADRPWTEGHATNHFGGTMSPTQNIPDGFSPYYIEFDEAFGGYNFGAGGNAQLDIKTMAFDWACG